MLPAGGYREIGQTLHGLPVLCGTGRQQTGPGHALRDQDALGVSVAFQATVAVSAIGLVQLLELRH